MPGAPLTFTWDGEAMYPLPRLAKIADERFVIGERYTLDEVHERSSASHRQYFAAIRESWLNLPEHIADRFATPEHLRKWCLVKCGYHDERSIVCSSKAEAQRLAAFIRPMDDFAVVAVSEAVVSAYTAKSQSYRAMGKKEFQASKQAVLDYLDSLLGVDPGETQRNAGQAA